MSRAANRKQAPATQRGAPRGSPGPRRLSQYLAEDRQGHTSHFRGPGGRSAPGGGSPRLTRPLASAHLPAAAAAAAGRQLAAGSSRAQSCAESRRRRWCRSVSESVGRVTERCGAARRPSGRDTDRQSRGVARRPDHRLGRRAQSSRRLKVRSPVECGGAVGAHSGGFPVNGEQIMPLQRGNGQLLTQSSPPERLAIFVRRRTPNSGVVWNR